MQSLLLLSAGVSIYVGLFHFGLRRQAATHRWLAAWAFAATALVFARLVLESSSDPATVLRAGRLGVALAPLLIWTILRFVGELTNTRPTRAWRLGWAVSTVMLAAFAAGTEWFTANRLVPRIDLFGTTYQGPTAGPAMLPLGLYVAASLAWVWNRLAHTETLRPSERRTLSVALTLYAALGATSILSRLELSSFPELAEFGPLVVAIGASQLVANRQRRLESDLSSLVDQQTAALRASEERYRGLVEHAPIGVALIDREGNVLAMTRRLLEMAGLPPERMNTPTNLLTNAALLATGAAGSIKRALERGEVVTTGTGFTTAAGNRLELSVVIAPQRASHGELKGAMLLVEDVTERRATEARLRQSQKLESIGQLAAGLAQGINPPLAEVRANLARLRSECEELRKRFAASPASESQGARFAELEELIDESSEGVERAIAITRDMGEISRGASLEVESVDLNEVLEAVVRIAATQRRGGVQIATRFGDIPPLPANAGQLRQVFLNLVMNAVQAVGEHGQVEIETLREGDGAVVRVRDDGPGIAPGHREQLFVPFFTTKPAGEGTGLGLFLSYQIVQSHAGEIRVQSEPGSGATFDVWLPLSRPALTGARA